MRPFYFFRFRDRDKHKGQGLVEYALILVLVAIVTIAIVSIFGKTVAKTYCTVVVELDKGTKAKIPKQCGSPIVVCQVNSATSTSMNMEAVVTDPDLPSGMDLTADINVTFYHENGTVIRTENQERFCLGSGGDLPSTGCPSAQSGLTAGETIKAVATDVDGNTGECTAKLP